MSVIEISDLRISYGQVEAVRGLNLTVERGEVVGLLGGNGAGKSSTLRSIAGVNPHTSGRLNIAGHDMSIASQAEAARGKVGYCPDVGGLIRQATIREHIALALAFRNRTHMWPQALELVEQFNLTHALDRVTQGFSHGMCRRLSVMLATLTAEDVLILDEPFDGVDPLGVDATLDIIQKAVNNDLGVLISTHLLDLVVASCTRVVVMLNGTVVDSEPVEAFAGEEGKRRYAELLRTVA